MDREHSKHRVIICYS